MVERPTWDEYGMLLASAASTRAACSRRQVGAAILDQDHTVVSMGYNGVEAGRLNCSDGGCPRGRHYEVPGDWIDGEWGIHGQWYPPFQQPSRCGCGEEWPCEEYVQPYSSYSNCRGYHAEDNAIQSGRSRGVDLTDCTIYVTHDPCADCTALIERAGITRVISPNKR